MRLTKNYIVFLGTEEDASSIETCMHNKGSNGGINIFKMSYTQLLHAVPEELRRIYRQYENVCKKTYQS